MAATRLGTWQPRPGSHSVAIGPALLAALDALDGGSIQTPLTELYSFRYDRRPDSFNYRKFSTIKDIKQSTCTLEVDVANSEDRHLYNGSLNQVKDFQCALIFDESTKSFTFEKLDTFVDLKYDRTGVPANESEGVHGPQNDSPTSGITAVSSSPPTPPNQTFAADNVKISGYDVDMGRETKVAVPVPSAKPAKSQPPRPTMGSKSFSVANVSAPPPPPLKGKGKRTRDAVDGGKDAPSRPAKRPTLPLPKTSGKSVSVATAQLPAPPPPAPLSLPKAPKRPPTPPTGARSPRAFAPMGTLDLSDDDEPPLSATTSAPKMLSSNFVLEVDENPDVLPVTGAHRAYSEGLVDDVSVNMDNIFDDLDDADGDEDDADGDGEPGEDDDDDEDDDEDEGFGQALEEAFSGETTATKPPPVSLNAFATGGDDPDDWAESSEEESD